MLFNQKPQLTIKRGEFPSVKKILKALLYASDKGLTFLFELEKSGIEFTHPGINLDYRADWKAERTIHRLIKQKYVSIRDNPNGSITIKISKLGQSKALTYCLDEMKLNEPKNWDKKWRVVTFDIPNKYKRIRDVFRMRLKQLGLYPFQESVYISPYTCFDEVEFLRELYGVPFKVKYLLVEKVEDDGFLKNHFHLS